VPENVALAVAVKVPGTGDRPGSRDGCDARGLRNLRAVEEPDRHISATCALKVRRQSGAARIVARRLLGTLGEPNTAVATVVRSGYLRSLGIDVEPADLKALYPLCGLFLDFHDIEIDLDAGSARVRDAHSARISFTEAPRVVALAVILRVPF
jgi:4'-phosphopantetheinyl transferase EntD